MGALGILVVVFIGGGLRRRLLAAVICGVITGLVGYQGRLAQAPRLGIPAPADPIADIYMGIAGYVIIALLVSGIIALARATRKPAK